MKILYCDSVFDNKIIEPDYEMEMKSAKKAGFEICLLSFEKLNEENINQALKFINTSEKIEKAIYRGWMLKPSAYEKMYNALLQKNIVLINSPAEYIHCHYLPESYEKIKLLTPKSSWTENLNDDAIKAILNEFGNDSIIVKDYVKSEKHNWNDACFIPNASDNSKANEVISKFLELRGNSLNVGLVFRKFEELEFLTKHSQSGMPLTKEFRIFFLNKKILKVFNYWDEGQYDEQKPILDLFKKIAEEVESNFFTMDVAQKKNGAWIIMELGDGQVAGLPDNVNKDEFYISIKEILQN